MCYNAQARACSVECVNDFEEDLLKRKIQGSQGSVNIRVLQNVALDDLE